MLVEHGLRYRFGDFTDDAGEAAGPLAAVNAVEAVEAGALEERVHARSLAATFVLQIGRSARVANARV